MDPITRHHYETLANNQAVTNPDGTVSTVYTIQVDIDGRPTLIPSVWDGEILDQDAATQRAVASGIQWPTADTHDELRYFDEKIHLGMEPISASEAQRILGRENQPTERPLSDSARQRDIF
jgi:hypothetical protein